VIYKVYQYSGHIHDKYGYMATDQRFAGEVSINPEMGKDRLKAELRDIFHLGDEVPIDGLEVFGDDEVMIFDRFINGQRMAIGYLKVAEAALETAQHAREEEEAWQEARLRQLMEEVKKVN